MESIHSFLQHLNPKIAKISYLENAISSIQIKLEALAQRLNTLSFGSIPIPSPLLPAIPNISPSPIQNSFLPAAKGKTVQNLESALTSSFDTTQNLPQKLELPIFDGDNPDEWLFRVERYFDINVLDPSEWLCADVVCLEGDALA